MKRRSFLLGAGAALVVVAGGAPVLASSVAPRRLHGDIIRDADGIARFIYVGGNDPGTGETIKPEDFREVAFTNLDGDPNLLFDRPAGKAGEAIPELIARYCGAT